MNNNLQHDPAEPIIPACITIQNKTYCTKERPLIVIDDLLPYYDYFVVFEQLPDLTPIIANTQVNLPRGSVTTLYVPYQEVEDIEGYIESKKNNIEVFLIDKKTQKIIARTKTRFGGYYLFRVPKYVAENSIVKF